MKKNSESPFLQTQSIFQIETQSNDSSSDDEEVYMKRNDGKKKSKAKKMSDINPLICSSQDIL